MTTLGHEEIEAQAAILRAALEGLPGIAEKRMFGGLCFLLDGNMLCGTWKHGGMFRVGKDNACAALRLPGATPMTATGRAMAGLVTVSPDALACEAHRTALIGLALAFVGGLPPKPPGPLRRR